MPSWPPWMKKFPLIKLAKKLKGTMPIKMPESVLVKLFPLIKLAKKLKAGEGVYR
jgi:hypothetical protein